MAYKIMLDAGHGGNSLRRFFSESAYGQELRHILSSETILNDRGNILFPLYQERKGTEYERKTAGTIQNREDFFSERSQPEK